MRSLLRNHGSAVGAFSLTLLSGMFSTASVSAQTPPPPASAPATTAVQPAPAAAPAAPAAETAESLLNRVDDQLNAFSDARFEFKLVVKESSGAREYSFSTIQMGQMRLVRFLSPGDVKGMGFLIENAESMYALLPGFNNRVRRIGTHQMSQSFMGSDVNSDDMSMVKFLPSYQPKLIGTDGDKTILELTARDAKKVAFPTVKMWVEQKRAIIARIEYMDAGGKKLRTQIREDYKQDSPANAPKVHYSPGKMTFIDHVKNNHQSELQLVKSETNVGLTKDAFTVRALQRDN